MKYSEDQLILALKTWIIQHSSDSKNRSQLSPEDNLINDGWINSLQIIELLSYIETLKGSPIDVSKLTHQNFKSIHSIINTIFTEVE